MAFFDDLKSKAREAAHVAAEKTRIMMETSKLNGQIDAEKKKINQNTTKIGEICLESFPNVQADSFANLVEEIKASHEKIADYSKQINKLKGIVKCEKCGTEVVNYDKPNCSNCGAALDIDLPARPAGGVACQGCGTSLGAGAAFCTNCGMKVEAAPEPIAVRACSNCATPAAEGVQFCTNCGTKIE
ncbi:MAG: zinc ribbon domain-containing protein [Defluviitaleaceae bacterium]|nr:zinc ribbon domain-containing protein [Defluviitaleaceae bacterium]